MQGGFRIPAWAVERRCQTQKKQSNRSRRAPPSAGETTRGKKEDMNEHAEKNLEGIEAMQEEVCRHNTTHIPHRS